MHLWHSRDPSEPLSQKTKSDKAAAAQATKAAGRSACRANAAANDLEKVINEHAKSISYTADELFKVEADVAQIHAKCIEITAAEVVKITCDAFLVNASGSIKMESGGTFDMEADGTFNVEAGGEIKMKSGSQLNFNDSVYIGSNLPARGSHLSPSMIGYDAYFHDVEIGGHLYIAEIQDENESSWTSGSLNDFITIFSASFIYTATGSSKYLEDAVSSFGSGSVDGNGVVSIPYHTFSGDGEGNITFDMAATAFFRDSMAAEYSRGYDQGKQDGANAFNHYGTETLYYYDDQRQEYFSAGRHNWYYK